jgi:hypothetical protein
MMLTSMNQFGLGYIAGSFIGFLVIGVFGD